MDYPEFTTEELESEEWRPVVGYEGFYEVSDLGRVRRVKRYLAILKPELRRRLTNVGYYSVHLSSPNRAKLRTVHQLVAEAFLGLRPPKFVTNHKDGVKTNNRPGNLEYVTHKENHQHASKMGLKCHGEAHFARQHPERMRRGEQNNKAKLTADAVREIRQRFAVGDVSKAALAREFGIQPSNITFIISGKTWAHI